MGITYHNKMKKYQHYFCNSKPQGQPEQVRVSYWGANTLVITDGESTLLIDPFFTRPGLQALLRHQQPDQEKILLYLNEAGVDRADAVLLTHAHFDHALDAAIISNQTQASLVGSRSAAMVGRGGGVPEDRIIPIQSEESVEAGSFVVTFIRSVHVPLPFPLSLFAEISKDIKAPLASPAYIWDFKAGETYALHIAHREGNLVVTGSAGWVPGGLVGWQADVVILAAGGLAWRDKMYISSYVEETVAVVQAKQVLVSHWDDFTKPLEAPLRFGGVNGNCLELLNLLVSAVNGCSLRLMPVGQAIPLFGVK
jgi:L-ascorbate metabolism protein UlaG (beta-lactamase superfamily)